MELLWSPFLCLGSVQRWASCLRSPFSSIGPWQRTSNMETTVAKSPWTKLSRLQGKQTFTTSSLHYQRFVQGLGKQTLSWLWLVILMDLKSSTPEWIEPKRNFVANCWLSLLWLHVFEFPAIWHQMWREGYAVVRWSEAENRYRQGPDSQPKRSAPRRSYLSPRHRVRKGERVSKSF